ncbi:hypothetical protein [Sphingomonas desiccabilis]|uniref:Uncharacterized protein n=1 Tax=Sphingomonas desiccabilis TaxID=429134 RepID=A0A4Q2J1D0_9SPHN|nr:hypothetical protein [Sphingomonas desiccabilis]MBB3910488.1 hypothetical protein [Sphingomonas desiccabilis]RXZ35132.1 hypothetical protein EO081_05695 [Sphingomonas desiccabilis]
MTTPRSSQAASALWILLLTLASVATTLVFKCATPFPALAAVAAVHMRAKDGVSLALLAWATSQLVGFCWLDYPLTANSLGWGAVMGVAAIAGALAAHRTAAASGAGFPTRLALSFVASFVAFKGMILLGTVVLDGGTAAFAPDVLLRQLARNAAVLGGLLVLHRLLTGLGVPPARTERALA